MEKPILPVLINLSKCQPCSKLICIGTCPLGLLEVGQEGKPEIVDVASCTRCGVCADLCPTKAITVRDEKSRKERIW